MSKEFSLEEKRVLSLFKIGDTFLFEGQKYKIILTGKPTCNKGEPKTDIYVRADSSMYKREFKISFKKENADFLENKISKERAIQLFGINWSDIIKKSTMQLYEEFSKKPLIFKNKLAKTEEGSITLGWKFELLNVQSGNLSNIMKLNKKQVIDVYSGTNLTKDKRDAIVDGNTIANSGIANFILYETHKIASLQDAINSLISIEEFANNNSNIYFACKALNYRSLTNKYDGDRPLSVYVDWSVKNHKLFSKLVFDTPLMQGGNFAYDRLNKAMDELSIKNTNDINKNNVFNPNIIYQNL